MDVKNCELDVISRGWRQCWVSCWDEAQRWLQRWKVMTLSLALRP